MSIYWSLKSVPELAPLPHSQRRQVHEQCLQRHFWEAPATRRSVAAYLIWIVMVATSVSLGAWLPRAVGVPDGYWFILISGLLGATVASYIFSRIAIPALRPFYREYIGRHL